LVKDESLVHVLRPLRDIHDWKDVLRINAMDSRDITLIFLFSRLLAFFLMVFLKKSSFFLQNGSMTWEM